MWPTVKGIVIKSEIYTDYDTSDNISTYRPEVIFSYAVGGEEFKSNRLYYGVKIMSSTKKQKSKRIVNKYKVNQVVDVFINPNKKKDAILEPGVHSELFWVFIFSIAFLAAGYLLLEHFELIITAF